jgi:hypothetical protein
MRRLIFALCLLAFDSAARAAEYETFVDVETQDDLDELRNNQILDDDAYAALSELLEEGIDLSKANADEIYALPNLTRAEAEAIVEYRTRSGGRIDDPLSLAAAGIIPEDKLLAIAPFLKQSERRAAELAVGGTAELVTTIVPSPEMDLPPILARAKVKVGHDLHFGVMARATHALIGGAAYDPGRDALSATAPSIGFDVPKFYAVWDDGNGMVIAGTYRIGFGQRLVLDTTGFPTPEGARPDLQFYYRSSLSTECRESDGELAVDPCLETEGIYGIGDFSVREGFRGVAAGVRQLELGAGWASLWAFGSLTTHSIYQYEIYRPDRCDDPRADSLEECSSPDVYRTLEDTGAPTSTWKFITLPDMWNELLAGANATFNWARRGHIGVTGWGAQAVWLSRGIELDFQEQNETPGGGTYGAIGMDVAYGWNWLDLYAEVARSFDGEAGGERGGYGAVVRGTASWGRNEIEVSGRYYDDGFANPHGRPIAASDSLEGNTARDEAGLRVTGATVLDRRLRLRGHLDLWQRLRAEVWRLRAYARADYKVTTAIEGGVWTEYADQGLDQGGRDQCYSGTTSTSDFGAGTGESGTTTDEDIEIEGLALCKGMKVKVAAEARYRPLKRLAFEVGAQHDWVDGLSGTTMPDAFRRDFGAWLYTTVRATDRLAVVGRARYKHYGTNNPSPMEQTFWATLGLTWREPKSRLVANLRYDLRSWLDDRDSTLARRPNPEHWFRLELEGKF